MNDSYDAEELGPESAGFDPVPASPPEDEGVRRRKWRCSTEGEVDAEVGLPGEVRGDAAGSTRPLTDILGKGGGVAAAPRYVEDVDR